MDDGEHQGIQKIRSSLTARAKTHPAYRLQWGRIVGRDIAQLSGAANRRSDESKSRHEKLASIVRTGPSRNNRNNPLLPGSSRAQYTHLRKVRLDRAPQTEYCPATAPSSAAACEGKPESEHEPWQTTGARTYLNETERHDKSGDPSGRQMAEDPSAMDPGRGCGFLQGQQPTGSGRLHPWRSARSSVQN